jgi:DNA-binding MarR family transcriptional regulator
MAEKKVGASTHGSDPAGAGTDPRGGGGNLGAEVWELTLRTITGLLRTFEDDMKAEGLALAWYDVLIQLSASPEKRLRMQDLADAVVLTRSGLSRLIDRMERSGLVQRVPAADDRRGSYAALTEEGQAAYERLRNGHQRKIDERFTSRLSATDLRALRRAMHKLGVVVNVAGASPER